jgi:hypothetical protein
MADTPWRLSEDETRLVRILRHLRDQATAEVYPSLYPFYKQGGQDALAQAYKDVSSLDDRGLAVKHVLMGGGPQSVRAQITGYGSARLDELDAGIANKANRRWACRVSLVEWMYDEDAVSLASGLSWDAIYTTPFGSFYGVPFEVSDIDAASDFLSRKDLCDGVETMQFAGPVQIYLTDEGLVCAEDFGSDVKRYLASKEGTPVGDTFHVSGQNNQVVKGDHAQQVMHLAPTTEQIALVIGGLVEIVHALNLVDEDLDADAQEAVADVLSGQPTGEAPRRFLGKIRRAATESASPAVAKVIVTAVEAVGEDLAHFVEQLAT